MPIGFHFQDERPERTRKSLLLVFGVAIFFFIIIIRLFYLQIIQYNINMRLSLENSMRINILRPDRGKIFDRNGIVLAHNRPSYSVCIFPFKVKDKNQIIENLLKITDSNGKQVFDEEELRQRMQQAYLRRFDITRLKEDVTMDIVSIIEEHSLELAGISVETEARREYTLGAGAFHVLGYMGEIPEEEFDSLKKQNYYYGDLIGRAGLEKQYEKLLRGKPGQEMLEVNAYGLSLGPIQGMKRSDPIAGSDLWLGLDAELQRVAQRAFPDSLKGAVVAIDPRNGEILIMYSSPSPDPNIFSLSASLRSLSWRKIATDPALPLNNRVTCGTYPPGSTFKLISALAGLCAGEITPLSMMSVACNGSYRIGNRVAKCWKASGHGRLNLFGAIQQSCNVYFYQLGLMLGDEVINKYAKMFGLGQPTLVDLPVEKVGWLSGEEEYNKRFARRGWKWTKGLVLDLAIGQTQLVTPIQLACMVGALGNGKHLYRPHLVREVKKDGRLIKSIAAESLHEINISADALHPIQLAMVKAIEPGGTGGRARVENIPVGGKTGSAENPHSELTHGLFVCCAPIDEPLIAIAVVVENAGHGGTVAAPIAGEILRYYFSSTQEGKQIVAKYEKKKKEKE